MAIHSASPDEKTTPLSSEVQIEIDRTETTLRPKALKDYIGQFELKDNLVVFLKAAKHRSEPLEHVLLHGPPGLGKTTLAHIIAAEMNAQIKITSGPVLERPGDVASIITNLEEGDVLFIDEIHRLKPVVEETLYSAMEDFAIDIVLGKGPSARSMRLNLPRFTLIGATTKLSLISSPLRDRFGHVFRLQFYSFQEMESILERSAGLLGIPLNGTACSRLATSSRQTPRIANRLLRRVRDFAIVEQLEGITLDLVERALESMGIDKKGLDSTDRTILRLLIEQFQGGPVGLNTLAAATHEEMQTLEDIYEPFLLQQGFLDRTPRGRVVTPNGYFHLGLMPPPRSMS